MTVPPGLRTAAIYLKNIQAVIQDGTTSLAKVTSKDTSTTIPVHCDLAASFGTLNVESVKQMSSELKVMISAVMSSLGKLKDLKWKSVLDCMTQNQILEPIEGSSITRSDTMQSERDSVFKTDGSPNLPIVNEVVAWFTKLIQDSDIMEDTKIDIHVLAKMVASSGAMITSFQTVFSAENNKSRQVVDVGVLRYPDIEKPYFKLYRIQLVAWRSCYRVLFAQKDMNGISGNFQSVKFKPRNSAIKQLRSDIIQKAVAEVEALFASVPVPIYTGVK